MIDTFQFGGQVLMIQSSLLSPFSTTNTKTLTFITYIHRNRSPLYDVLDWSWESIPTIVHKLWAGGRKILFLAGAWYWFSVLSITSRTSLGSHPALLSMGTAGSCPWIKGLRHEPDLSLASSMNVLSYTSTLIIRPAGMHKESFTFMMCWISHCPLHVEKIFKKNISFLCLVLCQEPSLCKTLLHLCVSSMHIVMYHHAQRNSDI